MSAPNDIGGGVAESPLVQVSELRKWFPVRGGLFSRVTGHVKAVDGVSFDVKAGETFGLVGESGCGKTTVGRSLLRLIEPTGGTVLFDGRDLGQVRGAALRRMRRDMQIIFQDPYGSLNPRMTVGAIIGEGIRVHGLARGSELDDRVVSIMERVGLRADYRARYPHEFSGGQRQRIGIARALAVEPRFIVCDEAVSALDVSIQAQILNLLRELQEEFSLTYLFISHDLNVVEHVADRVGVMYLGGLVETAPAEELFREPRHPYTRALLASNPIPDPAVPNEPVILEGEVPSPLHPPEGCHFHPRCPSVFGPCSRIEPPRVLTSGGDVRCHLYAPEGSAAPGRTGGVHAPEGSAEPT